MSRKGKLYKQVKCPIDSKTCHGLATITCLICPRNPKDEVIIIDESWMFLDAQKEHQYQRRYL